jgi:hypothetical protein
LGGEEEDGDDDPGFEGAMEVGGCVAEYEESEDYEEVDNGRRVSFDIEDEVEGISSGLG